MTLDNFPLYQLFQNKLRLEGKLLGIDPADFYYELNYSFSVC